MRTGSYDMVSVANALQIPSHNQSFVSTSQIHQNTNNSHQSALQKKGSIKATNASNKNLLSQNYLSAGNT
jgi:hypothetical protein